MRFLFVDRILQLVPGKSIRGIKHVTMNDAYLSKSPEGKYYFTPSLIGETVGQLAAWNIMFSLDFKKRPVAGVVSSAMLYRPVYMGETMELICEIDQIDDDMVCYQGEARVNQETVFRIENALGPLLPMDEFIDQNTIREQFAEIDRPGDFIDDSMGYQPVLPAMPLSTIPMCFDRILEIHAGESIVAEKLVSRAAPYFQDHFPKKPVLPMSVLLESLIHLAKQFLLQSYSHCTYRVAQLRKIKMNDFIRPGDKVTTRLTLKSQDDQQIILQSRSEVDGKRACVLDLIMVPGE